MTEDLTRSMRIVHWLADRIYASKIFKWLDRRWYGYPKDNDD